MKNETLKERQLRLQNLLKSVIKNLNKSYDMSTPTKVYFKDERLHVKGDFWNEAIIVAKVLSLSPMIVEDEHVYFF